ncbi:MAG: 6-phosphofructokinase, partial [Nitrospirales bacterium]|nr:6-phosphofructokinase [Nitrospirales bacterium]
MPSDHEALDFVTIAGLLQYGDVFARTPRIAADHIALPPGSPVVPDRIHRAREATDAIHLFVTRAQEGFASAADYRMARRRLLDDACGGDTLVFFAAWNRMLAEGALTPLLQAPIGTVRKPTRRRPVAIVPRTQLTLQLAEGRIVLDLGDDRYWLLPRDMSNRTLLFTMRHGVSHVESKTHRVGCRLANTLDPERGRTKADAVGAALARMVGVVGQQLDFLHLHNYLDPRAFLHFISRSPNTRELFERVSSALGATGAAAIEPTFEPALESSDFGWVTGVEKSVEAQEAATAFGVDLKTAKRLLKHPLYSYPGGHSFFDLYVDVIDGLHQLAQSRQGHVACLYTHSSTMRALMIYLDPRPFHEAFGEFSDYKEGQDNVVLLTYEQDQLSGYSTAVGLSAHERTTREAWISVEQSRRDRVTLQPRQLRRLVALVSGGDFAGAGAALKELYASGSRFGVSTHFVRHGFLGLANNWIHEVQEHDTRGMVGQASSPIGSSRFEDFKDERIQQAAIRHLQPYMENGALVVL